MPRTSEANERLKDLRSEGHLSRAMIEDYEFLVVACGVPHVEAARRVGAAPRTIEKRYSRLGSSLPNVKKT